MKIVHLPFFKENPYQTLLMEGQSNFGHELVEGGSGGKYLGTLLKSWKPDVVHFHWLHPYILGSSHWETWKKSLRFLFDVSLIKIFGARIVWTIHNLQNHNKEHTGVENRVTKIFLKMVDVCIVHSEAAKKAAIAKFELAETKISVVPHGNYLGVYPNAVSKEYSREKLKIRKDVFCYAFIGRIERYKGIIELLSAFEVAPKDSVLLVTGKPADAEIDKIIRECAEEDTRIIYHPGLVAEQDFQFYFNAADIVVFPYNEILTSGATLLAMSFGSAVIVPDRGGIRETVSDQGGIYFDPGTKGSLDNALVEAYSSDKLSRMKEYNRKRVELWNWDTIAEKTLKAYQG